MERKKEELSLFNIITLSASGAIGSGIFVMMGTGIGFTGKSIIFALLAGCLIMAFAYGYNFILCSMFKLEGGFYSQQAFLSTPLISGMSALFTFANCFALAMYAVAAVEYVGVIFPSVLPYKVILAVLIQTVLFAATIKGTKFIAAINGVMSVILLASIVVFVVVGLPQVDMAAFTDTSDPNFFRGGFSGFLAAISFMAWACQGTTHTPITVVGETYNPTKTIPKGMCIGVLIVATVYVLMGTVSAGVLPIDQVADQSLGVVAKEIFPNSIYIIFILGGAVFAILTSLTGGIIQQKNPLLIATKDGWLPKVLGRTTKDGYPYVIMLIVYLASVIPILTGTGLDTLVSYTMIPVMLIGAFCNYRMLKIPLEYPKQWEKSIFHMPYKIYRVLIICTLIANVFICYNLFVALKSLSEQLIVIGIAVGAILISYFRIKGGYVDLERLQKEKDKIVEQALLS